MRTIAAGTAALAAVAALTITGCQSGSHPDAGKTPALVIATPSSLPAPTPSPLPSPDGTFTGSCNYTLNDSFSETDAATFTGEVDETNTGNIGEVVRVRISWPQEGFAPISMTKHVRVPFGGTKAVRFHFTANQEQISNLQNWQEGHNFRDGCHYRSVIISPYGTVH